MPQTLDFTDEDDGLGSLIVGSNFGPFDFVYIDPEDPSRDVGTFTVNASNDTLTCNGHGLENDDKVRLRSDDTLPAPFVENKIYFVINSSTNTFKLSLTEGGAAIDILGVGVGTHTVTKRGSPLDLTGQFIYAWVKNSVDDATSEKVLDLAPTITSAADGAVRIFLLKDITDNALAGFHFWSLVRKNADAEILRPDIEGLFTIKKVSTFELS